MVIPGENGHLQRRLAHGIYLSTVAEGGESEAHSRSNSMSTVDDEDDSNTPPRRSSSPSPRGNNGRRSSAFDVLEQALTNMASGEPAEDDWDSRGSGDLP
jgi:hypothetical protein